MVIVIPMAGESRRFAEAGYDVPKYMLPLLGKSVFHHAVESFAAYFDNCAFLFIYRDIKNTGRFLREACEVMNIAKPHFAELPDPTGGQAETVSLGLTSAGLAAGDGLTIFNIDTFRPGFRYPDTYNLDEIDGYLEVFEGGGPNWSYARPLGGDDNRVAETAEKREISNLCSTGLYYFRNARRFNEALAAFKADGGKSKEAYVAPLYNHLIAEGADIRYHKIDRRAVQFCGVPAEYEAIVARGLDDTRA